MKVGVVLLIAQSRDTHQAPTFHDVRDMAVAAEMSGFDSIWLYDHLFYRTSEDGTIGIWECWTFLSALAAVTDRMQLGPLVACTQFRNPAIFAKMAATLNEVSQGRLILGLGAGWNEPEFKAFGIPFDHRFSRFEEAIQIIAPLLREGRVTFRGRYYQAIDCEIEPRGPGRVPIMIGSGSPRMLHLTARYADMWNVGYFAQPSGYVETLARMWAACDETGRDPNSVEPTALLTVAYPELATISQPREEYLTGAEEIAAALAGFEDLGVGHVMIHLIPNNLLGLERLTEALALYRERHSRP